jgi:hypothetical protein
MTTIYTKRLALRTAILTACAGAALAEDPHTLEQCRAISNTAERLACYDKLAGSTPASKAPPSSPAAAAPAAAPVSAAPVSAAPTPAPAQAAATPTAAASATDFGLSKVQKERANGEANSPAEIKSITSQVTGFRKGPSGRPRVLLDNGQTWEYEEDGDYLLAIGDSVTIRRASLGSFLLVTPAKLVHRVRRIR